MIEDLSKLRDPALERPRLWIKDMRMAKFEVGRAPALEVTIVNGGKTPAKETSIAATCWIGGGEMHEIPEANLSPKNTPIFIAPNDAMKATVEFPTKFADLSVKNVTERKETLWVTGAISYVDVHSTPYLLKFKGPYDVDKAKFPLESIKYDGD